MKPSDLPTDKRTRCEVWTRVMGYHRPVSQFNPGKQSEHRGRRHFTEAGAARGSAVKHLALISLLYLLAGCAGGPPTFSATLSDAAGKKVMRVQGAVQDNRPWLERYAGPAGALISGLGWIFFPAAPAGTP